MGVKIIGEIVDDLGAAKSWSLLPPMHTSPLVADPRLNALLELLIPSDDQPGAARAEVASFVVGAWKQRLGLEQAAAALDALDAEARAMRGAPFTQLDGDDAAALISKLETGRAQTRWEGTLDPSTFIAELVDLTFQGFYGAANGEPRRAPGWAVVGYTPRAE